MAVYCLRRKRAARMKAVVQAWEAVADAVERVYMPATEAVEDIREHNTSAM